MNKWAFFSIAVICLTAVEIVDRFYPEYEDD